MISTVDVPKDVLAQREAVPIARRVGWVLAMLITALSWAGCGQNTVEEQVAVTPTVPGPSPPPPAPAHPVVERLRRGIDVSGHSGSVDWEEVVSEGHTFAFVKATEGVDLEDPLFGQHWPEMKAAGILRGAYHFFVTEDDPDQQADFFIENVRLESGDLAPVVDIELMGHGTQSGLATRLQTFLTRLEAHYRIKPIIYTAPNFWKENMNDQFGEYPLWACVRITSDILAQFSRNCYSI